ncbi:MAG TPA: flagellar biosynthetic protein FliQ [Firmicutes bacterium]|nr:flagellar biosynthetic protein FliQ [Bacillota bacterium]
MTENLLLTIMQDAFMTLFMVAGPIVGISMIVGLIISIFQATTQIQEQTLTFVPKLISVILVLMIMGPYFINTLTGFFERMYEYIGLLMK